MKHLAVIETKVFVQTCQNRYHKFHFKSLPLGISSRAILIFKNSNSKLFFSQTSPILHDLPIFPFVILFPILCDYIWNNINGKLWRRNRVAFEWKLQKETISTAKEIFSLHVFSFHIKLPSDDFIWFIFFPLHVFETKANAGVGMRKIENSQPCLPFFPLFNSELRFKRHRKHEIIFHVKHRQWSFGYPTCNHVRFITPTTLCLFCLSINPR